MYNVHVEVGCYELGSFSFADDEKTLIGYCFSSGGETGGTDYWVYPLSVDFGSKDGAKVNLHVSHSGELWSKPSIQFCYWSANGW